MDDADRGSPAARGLLVAVILAVALGPRIRVPGLGLERAVDLRLQDLLLVGVALFLGTRIPSLRSTWGPWAALFAVGATAITLVRLLADPSVSWLRTAAYLGRGLETLVLAAAVAGLFALAGPAAGRVALRTLLVTVLINSAWLMYQVSTGIKQTLLLPELGDQLDAYGPKLVGEGSAFGTGIFFAFTAALGCACWLNKRLPPAVSAALVALGMIGAFIAQSRVSLGAVAVCILLLAFLPVERARRPVIAWLLGVIAIILVYAFGPGLPQQGRLSSAGFLNSLDDRAYDWYGPLLTILFQGTNPLTGIGVGRLGTTAYPYWTEAHNLFLRAFLDFGIVVGSAWLAIFFTAAARSLRASTRLPATETRFWATLAGVTLTAILAAGLLQESLAAVMSTHLAALALGLYAGSQQEIGADVPVRRMDDASGHGNRASSQPADETPAGEHRGRNAGR